VSDDLRGQPFGEKCLSCRGMARVGERHSFKLFIFYIILGAFHPVLSLLKLDCLLAEKGTCPAKRDYLSLQSFLLVFCSPVCSAVRNISNWCCSDSVLCPWYFLSDSKLCNRFVPR